MSQQINLYNPRFRKKTNYVTLPALVGLTGVTLAVMLALAMMANQRVAKAQADANRVQKQLGAVEAQLKEAGNQPVPQKNPQVAEQLAQAESDNRALQEVSRILEKGEIGNTRGYSAYFSAFARSRVQGLWLTGVQIVGAGNEIGLQGRTLQPALLPGYLAGLAREPVLKGKAFGQLEMTHQTPAAAPVNASQPAAPAGPAFIEFNLRAHQEGAAATGAEAK